MGYAFCTFGSHSDALKCLRVLNNHPQIFFKDKRPIVEFAVENAKAIKLLEDRRERIIKKKELKERIEAEEGNGQVDIKPKKKLRPWQQAKLDRKKKRRLLKR